MLPHLLNNWLQYCVELRATAAADTQYPNSKLATSILQRCRPAVYRTSTRHGRVHFMLQLFDCQGL